jgi:hypothetical protein
VAATVVVVATVARPIRCRSATPPPAEQGSAGSGTSDAEAAPDTGGRRAREPESAGAPADSSRTRDTLDTAIRLYRASRGDVGGAASGGAGSGRHALSEAA